MMTKEKEEGGIFIAGWRALRRLPGKMVRSTGSCTQYPVIKLCRKILLCCLTVIAVLVTWTGIAEFYKYQICPKILWPYLVEKVYERTPLSNTLQFQHLVCRETGNVYNKATGRVMLDDVDWVVMPQDKDSLAVFSRYGKRGYINRFTGKVAIPALYTRAWVFSEGLAGVEHNGKLKFIDPTGKVVIDSGYQPCRWSEAPVFKDGLCIVRDTLTEKAGLIDRQGNLILPMKYNGLDYCDGYWIVQQKGRYGLYHPLKGWMFQPEHLHIMTYDDRIHVLHQDHVTRIYDTDGKMTVDMVIAEVTQLEYPTGDMVRYSGYDTPYQETAVAKCLVYTADADDYMKLVGLMDRKGRCLTPPLYESITAVALDRYLCLPQGILLDSNGEQVDSTELCR